jgi:hypothetical protein
MYSRKIILKGGRISNDDSSRCLTSTTSDRVLSEKISAATTRNTGHTVTHVTQISPVHCSNEGLDFILSHLSDPIWPRTVSAKVTDGRQTVVNSRDEAIAYFKALTISIVE